MKLGPLLCGAAFAMGSLLACACQPLGNADPLDSGELSAAVMRPASSIGNRVEERQAYSNRVNRLSSEQNYGTELRTVVGTDLSSDF